MSIDHNWAIYWFYLLKFHLFSVIYQLNCLISSEQLLVLIEYVPFGDLLGYLRKSRGLKDTYYKDPDIKPQTNLTSQQLMKFAWQIADGMSYLSSKFVSWKKKKKQRNKKHSKFNYGVSLWGAPSWYNVISLNAYAWEVWTYLYHLVKGLSYRDPIHFQRYHLLFFFLFKLRSAGYLIRDLNCFHFHTYHFRFIFQRWSK